MGIVRGVVLGLVSVLLGFIFVIVGITHIGSGYWFSYVSIAAYAVGAIGCALAARPDLIRNARVSLPTQRVTGVCLGLAAALLAVFAVRLGLYRASHTGIHSAAAHAFRLTLVALDALGAVGCLLATRSLLGLDRGPVASSHG